MWDGGGAGGETMTITISVFWAQVSAMLLVAGITGLVALLLGVIAKLEQINLSIKQIEGKMETTNQWQSMHEQLDQERHERSETNSQSLWRAIEKLCKS